MTRTFSKDDFRPCRQEKLTPVSLQERSEGSRSLHFNTLYCIVIKSVWGDGSSAAARVDNWRFLWAGQGEDRQRLQQNPGVSFTVSPLLSAHMEAPLSEFCSGILQWQMAGEIPLQHRCTSLFDMVFGVDLWEGTKELPRAAIQSSSLLHFPVYSYCFPANWGVSRKSLTWSLPTPDTWSPVIFSPSSSKAVLINLTHKLQVSTRRMKVQGGREPRLDAGWHKVVSWVILE